MLSDTGPLRVVNTFSPELDDGSYPVLDFNVPQGLPVISVKEHLAQVVCRTTKEERRKACRRISQQFVS